MTLVLALRGRTTIWMLADRRLTAGQRIVSDSATKLVRLESDGHKAIIGYAGLGATAAGTQPSEWMNNVFRGRRGPLEHLLGILAEAGLNELPKHIEAGKFNHTAIAVALKNRVPVTYGVGVRHSADSNQYEKYYTKYQTAAGNAPPVVVGGSGAAVVASLGIRAIRPLLRLARAAEKGQISANKVSDEMAALSYRVHLVEGTVGPRSIVLWTDKNGTGGQACYTGASRDANCSGVPTIANGMDVGAIAGLTMRMMFESPSALVKGQFPNVDVDRINEELRKLPSGPNEKLK